MNSWLLEAGLCLGLILLAFACFHNRQVWLRRLGGILLVGTSGLALWFWTENAVVAAVGMSAWFVLPMVQAAWLSRRLRFSVKRQLESGHLNEDEFPGLSQITSELRKLGFRMNGDFWLKPSPVEQGYRILSHTEEPIYAAIAILRYGHAALVYMIFTTPSQDGTVWLTWDYPLAYGLLMPPHLMIHRCLEAESAGELFNQHKEFLKLNQVSAKIELDSSPETFFEKLFLSTVDYNLQRGILGSADTDQGREINYTWWGTLFVSWQVFWEVVKG